MNSRSYKDEFIELAIEREVLCFGEFTLKSGRISPYFFNAGRFDTGRALSRLGRFYALAIKAAGISCDMLFGPAYKGIPLVAATAIALAEYGDRDMPYAFNRKEIKGHGEGGEIVGADLRGRVIVIDDVVTAGTAIRQSVETIRAHGAEPLAVAVSLDRQEKGSGSLSAIQEVREDLGLQVISIATMTDLISYLEGRPERVEAYQAVSAYRARYGVSGTG